VPACRGHFGDSECGGEPKVARQNRRYSLGLPANGSIFENSNPATRHSSDTAKRTFAGRFHVAPATFGFRLSALECMYHPQSSLMAKNAEKTLTFSQMGDRGARYPRKTPHFQAFFTSAEQEKRENQLRPARLFPSDAVRHPCNSRKATSGKVSPIS
jgi:hypothetical protein